MFTATNGVSEYNDIGRFSGIENSSPHKLVDIMYSTAIDRLSQATGMIERNETVAKGQAISKTISIIEELRRTLDMEKGGDVAISFHDLYVYINERLVTANMKNDITILDECKSLIRELQEGWNGIPEDVRNDFSSNT